MKKFLLSAALMLSSVTLLARNEVGTITIQPKIGMNVASLTKMYGYDARIGLAVGAEVEYQVTNIFSVSGGLMYSQQGNKYSERGSKTTDRLDYINIPILANVYVIKDLAVKIGIQPGFNVKGETKLSGDRYSVTEDIDGVKSFDFTIPVGVSYEYQNIVLDARYNFGTTKVFDGAKPKNSVFQITLGYKFSL